MPEATHTLLPWKLVKVGSQWAIMPTNKNGQPRNGRGTEDICSGSTYTDNWAVDSALLLSAPDMLAFIHRWKEIVCGHEKSAEGWAKEFDEEAAAVISKATGTK